MTANTPDGKPFFHAERIYMPQAGDSRGSQMVLGPDKKLGFLRDTSIQPFAPKEDLFEIPLPPGVHQGKVEVDLRYEPRPGNVYPLHRITRTASLIAN
ncbi:MAG: hypothetical protein LDL11_05745 [Desulfarculus sp.]|nr:hypothetical protein [Desulfarculus sp.]